MGLLTKRSVPAMLMALAVTVVSVVALLHSLGTHGLLERSTAEAPRVASLSNRIADHGTHLVYVPDGVSFDRKHWLLFALSPSGQALPMISKWHKVADRHAWVLTASKESKNGVPFDIVLGMIEAELRSVTHEYPVDASRVFFTGFSGGGMASHAFAKFYPNLVSGVVINTGMMEQSFMIADYPEQKLAVFLASPTDFRYNEMRRDLAFCESHHWKTKWIEFAGGHVLAPDDVCEQAAQWLEENVR
jgi:hypothetical protein